jgi:hypothetical protein
LEGDGGEANGGGVVETFVGFTDPGAGVGAELEVAGIYWVGVELGLEEETEAFVVEHHLRRESAMYQMQEMDLLTYESLPI